MWAYNTGPGDEVLQSRVTGDPEQATIRFVNRETNTIMRALVIGHFSTVGDIESLEYVKGVLGDEGIGWDILPYKPEFVPFIAGAIDRSTLSPSDYTHLIAVCGPFWPELLARRGIELDRFAHCTRIGVNLTMVRPVETWNPFHLLLERDSTATTRPDITFLQATGRVPVAGVCTIARQREYGPRQRHDQAVSLLRDLVKARDLATIDIDTRWPKHRNQSGLGSPDQVMSLIQKVDVLLTNRLHGMVYALRAGVPVIAVDPVLGSDKIIAQAKVLGWPAVATVEAASSAWMNEMLDWCLSTEGRRAAQLVAAAARTKLQPADEQLREALHTQFYHEPLPAPPGPAVRSFPRRVAKALLSKLVD